MHETLALRSLNCTSPGSTPGAAQGLHVGGGLVIELSLRGGHGMIFLGTDWWMAGVRVKILARNKEHMGVS